MLEVVLNKAGRPLTHVIQISVSEQVILDRIRHRGGAGESARSDDSAEVAAHRFQVYLSQTAPVAAYYKQKGSLHEVDGIGSVEEVFNRVCAVLS
jgi:adenylate kinase